MYSLKRYVTVAVLKNIYFLVLRQQQKSGKSRENNINILPKIR